VIVAADAWTTVLENNTANLDRVRRENKLGLVRTKHYLADQNGTNRNIRIMSEDGVSDKKHNEVTQQ